MDLKQKYLLTSSFNYFGPNVSVSLKSLGILKSLTLGMSFRIESLYKYPIEHFHVKTRLKLYKINNNIPYNTCERIHSSFSPIDQSLYQSINSIELPRCQSISNP